VPLRLARCVFSCFAEPLGLLPENHFRRTLETTRRSGDHERLALALTSLWQTMDGGGIFGAESTARAYIERLVEPTVIEPMRERWTVVHGFGTVCAARMHA